MDIDDRKCLVRQYGEGPVILQEAWHEAPKDCRHWKPAPSAWSAHEIIVHCADSETFAATRIRLLAAGPEPHIIGYNQDEWAVRFDYAHLSADLAFAAVSAVRALTFELINQFPNDAWSASGIHSESGTYSAEDWLRTYAAHLHDHSDQIRANVSLWRASQ